jgi:hypothetical protein
MITNSTKEEFLNKISVFKDPNFVFEEGAHTYHYKDIKYDSVTGFIKRFKVPFDRQYWSNRKAKERGVDVSVILEEWQGKANVANDLGTKVHKWIEDFWGGEKRELVLEKDGERLIERVGKFMELYDNRFKNLVPLTSELKIFSRKWRLAGTIDQPFLMWDTKQNKVLFLIGDWKTNKEFKSDDHPNGKYKKLLHPFSHLWENHLNEYSIQVSLYRLMLEDEIGLETHGGFLCHIGPEGPAKIYPTKDLRQHLRVYLQNNREDFDIFDLKN